MITTLPVQTILSELREHLKDSHTAILCAPPGSGKTTLVPPALLTEPWLGRQSILLVQPRRLAAQMTAGFMAESRGEGVGETVGYQVRFDKKISSKTKIEVVTVGILLRRLQGDPELSTIGLIIFDEFHERSLDYDLALAMVYEVMSVLREGLRLLIMSATLDAAPIAKLLNDAPIIKCQGKMYPVASIHITPPPRTDTKRGDHVAINTANAIKTALNAESGDILGFLPGSFEIRHTLRLLQEQIHQKNILLLPLFGELNFKEQKKAVRPDPQGRRKIILATTIAETSITIEGISIVVDCGWKRIMRFDPNNGLSRLDTVRISKASAVQRQGRAGRLGPGSCYRLWSKGTEQGLLDFDRPEITEADLSGLLLHLATWGSSDPAQYIWLTPPPNGALQQAKELLVRLGALDKKGVITKTGLKMNGYPLHPRLAHMVLQATRFDCPKLGYDLAALLSERDIIINRDSSADIQDRLQILSDYRAQNKIKSRTSPPYSSNCRRIDKISKQLAGIHSSPKQNLQHDSSVGLILAQGFPDRIAKQHPERKERYTLAAGRSGFLQMHDHLSHFPFLVVANLDAGKKDGRIYLAAAITKEEILDHFASQLKHIDEIRWDNTKSSVLAKRFIYLDKLVIEETPLGDPDPDLVTIALLAGIRQKGLSVLPWTKKAIAFQQRVQALSFWQPESSWPNLSDEHLLDTLEKWLAPYLLTFRRLEQLRSLKIEEILRAHLDWKQLQQLEREAPTHIRVPSGSNIKLKYKAQDAPILAVRIQEMFGLSDTPTICNGQIPVIIHLLSPAQRPLQVTSDLKNFWDGSYHEVKKEMKGRYPKHYWPDDPWNTPPTKRAKPKK